MLLDCEHPAWCSLAGTVEEARAWLERGFRCIAYGLDAWLYEDALRAGLAQLDAARNAR